ncbi:precorrin-6y C5,15-methyltransferase (decarboxylating) subunit CbiE [Nocardioides sp. CBS4Y-1]|uniref:Precorrin-6y C5,15-methyltransferase (Decarboxylating) subunit CbiE n=2 Tax=Nocardioides acrostichi TaxID=2784339 RepID=A0A930Y848_9ACTN|nr:precorrin-6y C5,15-methyltransferase (decarboxylating) subunit CbiE [Nocardioides acrostichi]
MGADGWGGLPDPVRERLLAARVVLGGHRHLDLLPAVPGQVREPWGRPFRASLEALLATHRPEGGVVVLASGDPLVSGVGTTVVALLGAEHVEVVPAVSSVALARARLGWSAEQADVVTVVGRRCERVLREVAPGRRLLVLTSDATTPAEVAGLLVGAGHGDAVLCVLGDLGATTESRRTATAADWHAGRAGEAPALHVLAIEIAAAPGAEPVTSPATWAAGLPDEAFEHDGQLSKRDVRASALARLAPAPGQLLWDVGAGAGSVGIEWMRAHPTCRTVALEQHPERAERVRRNAARLGVPDLEVREGRAPEALTGLPDPDAVFVGGGATAPGLLEACRARLRPGGRLVVHGVTLETEALLAAAYAAHGGELTRLAVEHAAPIGTMTGWTPARTVTQWSWVAPPRP